MQIQWIYHIYSYNQKAIHHVKVKINIPSLGGRSRNREAERFLSLNPSHQDSHVYIQNNDITNILVSMLKISKPILIPQRKHKKE